MVSKKHGFLETWFPIGQKTTSLPIDSSTIDGNVECVHSCCTSFILASNLIEIQRMDPIRIATWRIFRENIFYIFEKLNYQCKVNIIYIKSLILFKW